MTKKPDGLARNKLSNNLIIAPDGSEIRLLHELTGGGLSECTLPAKRVSLAVAHRTVEEIWLFTSGCGQVWRKLGQVEEVLDVKKGVSLTIPLGTYFQFRNTGSTPLKFIISTMPPWPGKEEAYTVPGKWPPS